MKKAYRLVPTLHDNIWGGNRLREYGKQSEKDRIAESWELSFHKDGPTRLENGKTLQETATAEELGKNCEGFPFFPVLAKLIDAKQDLSVQVHPSDSYALEHENSFGKTEMWYIVEADEGAGLYVGFSRDVSREEYENAIADGTLCDLLNFYPVQKGECYFIPAGTIHAIGAGCLICEIQQNSNTTYRVYDYNRRDKNGNLRPLHVEKALAVSDLKKSPALPEIPDGENVLLAECGYFEVRRLRFAGEGSVTATAESFTALTVTEGEGSLSDGESILSFRKGDTLFIPAQETSFAVTGACEMILSRAR